MHDNDDYHIQQDVDEMNRETQRERYATSKERIEELEADLAEAIRRLSHMRGAVEGMRDEAESHKNATSGITTQQLYAYEIAAYERVLVLLDELEATP